MRNQMAGHGSAHDGGDPHVGDLEIGRLGTGVRILWESFEGLIRPERGRSNTGGGGQEGTAIHAVIL